MNPCLDLCGSCYDYAKKIVGTCISTELKFNREDATADLKLNIRCR